MSIEHSDQGCTGAPIKTIIAFPRGGGKALQFERWRLAVLLKLAGVRS